MLRQLSPRSIALIGTIFVSGALARAAETSLLVEPAQFSSVTSAAQAAAKAAQAAAAAAVQAATAAAQAKGEAAEAQAFLAVLPEIKHLVGKAITQVGPGLYQVNLGAPGLSVYLVKQGGWSAVLLAKDTTKFNVGSFVPENILGKPTLKTAFAVISAVDGSLNGGSLAASDLKTALATLPQAAAYKAGVNLFAQFAAGDAGLIGQLKKGGILPGEVLLTGQVTRALSDGLFKDNGAAPTSSPETDLSMALIASTTSFTPAPFNQIASPKLTFGNLAVSLTRTGSTLSIAGEQKNSTLLVDGKTFTIPTTKFTFTPDLANGGYTVVVEGSTTVGLSNVFGIKGVTINSLGVKGTMTSTPTQTAAGRKSVAGFGLDVNANVSVGGKAFDGSFSTLLEGGKLKDLSLNLSGDLDLGFTGLPGAKDFVFKGFGVGVNPSSGQGYVYGSMSWKDLQGEAAAVMVAPGKPALFLQVKDLDFGKLLKTDKLKTMPKLNAVIVLGAGKQAGTVDGFPAPVKDMIQGAAGTLPRNIQLADGLTLLTHIDAASIGADKLGITGNLVLGGAFDVLEPSASFYASLTSIPEIKGLPAGFGIDAPEFLLNLGMKDRVPFLDVGVGMSLKVPLNGDPKNPLIFRGQVLASTLGNFSFTGSMETDWVAPLGLKDVTIKSPVAVTIGVGLDASVDFGFQGGIKISTYEYNPMAFCINIQAAAPVPVPKKLALSLNGSEFGVMTEVSLVHSLVKSAIEGPLKNGIPDADVRKILTQIGAGSDQILAIANGLPLPLLTFKTVEVYLATPAITCQLPAFDGMGAKLKGTAFFMGRELGNIDSYITVKDGLKIYTNIKPFNFYDLVVLNQATLDILLPMPGSASFNLKDPGHFYLDGDASVLLFKGKLHVALDKNQASFEVETQLADLGNARMWAKTIGSDLLHATDFQVGLRASSDAEKVLLKKLGAAMKATAAARKVAAQAAKDANTKAIKDAEATFANLDATEGKKFRDAEAEVTKAQKSIESKRASVKKAYDDCCAEKWTPHFTCVGIQEAGDKAISFLVKGLDGVNSALDGIRKGVGYANWVAAKGSVATVKAEATVVQGTMDAWGAMDKVITKIADGAADNLISLDALAFDGKLRTASGSLAVTAKVGGTPIKETYTVNLMDTKAALDVKKLADKIGDEIERQAKIVGSAIQKATKG